MRPLELRMEGFRSYRAPVTFTFEGRGLFGIVGPTGAGKSSILDAMIYCLYGKAPNIQRGTTQLINTSCDEARVQLVFEADEVAWEVTRVIKKKGSAPVVLKRLSDGEVVESGAKAVTERLILLLGLDFDGFCSSVTLPQGEFDRFLKASPGDKARILKGIFRFERLDALRDQARARLRDVEVALRAHQSVLAGLPEDPDALLQELAGEIEKVRARAEEIHAALPEEDQARRRREDAERKAGETDDRLGKVRASVKEIPDVAELEELAELEDSRARAFKEAETSLRQASGDLKKAQKEATAQAAEVGGETLGRARDLLKERRRLEKEIASRESLLETLSKSLQEISPRRAQAQKVLTAARRQRDSAEKALFEAHHNHAAHTLRKDLEAGQPCPVCEQKVAEVPSAGKAPELRTAEKARARAEEAFVAATAAIEGAATEEAVAKDKHSTATGELKKLTRAQAAAIKQLGELLGEDVDPQEEVARREKLLEDLERSVDRAREQADRAAAAEKGARESLEKVKESRRGFAQKLIRIAERLEVEPPSFEDDASLLVHAAKKAADAGSGLIEALNKEIEQYQEEAAAAVASIDEFRRRLGLAEGETAADALAAVKERLGALQSDIGKAEEAKKRRAEIGKEVEELEDRRGHLERLVSDLADAKFPAYLLDGHRRLLTELGSLKLRALTNRYRFDDEGDFTIVDEANGVIRTADTLSGGETFLASLALALALAEAVARQGGRLDCFFLDEGFGSLDRESLVVALEGIETVAAPGRLIGLISHVPDLPAQLDDLIVLDKDEEGSTVVVQSEGPISYPYTSI